MCVANLLIKLLQFVVCFLHAKTDKRDLGQSNTLTNVLFSVYLLKTMGRLTVNSVM